MKEKLLGVKENVSLAEHTTFEIGGPARYFFEAENKDDLIKAVKTAKKFNLPFFILGNGSNILFSDKGFNGLLVKCQMSNVKCSENKIYADAGVKLKDLVEFSVKKSLAGLEWIAGIPGTVGGAIYGNTQAFYNKMSALVESVEVFDINDLKIKNFSEKECQFSVKNSIFKKKKNLIILSAILIPPRREKKGSKGEIEEKIEEFLKYRKENHSLDFPSAGSIFINPIEKGKVIPAGFLIDKCGLKGKKINNAQISKKHANFIINLGNAKSEDVIKLIELAKQKVKEKFNIELKEEIRIIF